MSIVYNCPLCNSETTFPRYNSVRKLLETRQGRCGEFANLFGLVCRSVGFETRYILDLTDHVWVEVWSHRLDRWIMADSCEGKIDAPLMYEHGWGKKLSHIFAYNSGCGDGPGTVVDVTRRYTRNFNTSEFQSRRAKLCPEATLETIIQQLNSNWTALSKVKVSAGRAAELDRRRQIEEAFLNSSQSRSHDIRFNPHECEGRISGSLLWRAARKELGEGNDEKASDVANKHELQREIFLPVASLPRLEISVKCIGNQALNNKSMVLPYHEAIVVSGTKSAVGDRGFNIVVLDETIGCILQSKVFGQLKQLDKFVDTIPDKRIILVSMIGMKGDNIIDVFKEAPIFCKRVGAFPEKLLDATAFVGQVGYEPDWATSVTNRTLHSTGTVGIRLTLEFNKNHQVKYLIYLRYGELNP